MSEQLSLEACENKEHSPSPLERGSGGEAERRPAGEAERGPAGEANTQTSIAKRYLIMKQIGQGAQGKVFTALDLTNQKVVVIKQLNIESIKNWKAYELFGRETEVLRSLDMDGVARFIDSIECLDAAQPCAYIVQEYIEGVSLQKMLNDGHRFGIADVYEILIQTLTILDKLHHHDPPIIHRDIKPSNLMITPKSNGKFSVTIIDFGAVANPQIQGGGSTIAGTYGYMAPEQLMGRPDPASDVYAVGALAVQLFSGTSPADIPVKDFRLIFEPLVQDKPHELVTLLRNMLEPKAEDRFTDIAQIIKKLRQYRAGIYTKTALAKSSSGYDVEFERKIMAVESVCEPGSIELWQKLPDCEQRPIPQRFCEFSKSITQKNVRAQNLKKGMHKFKAAIAGIVGGFGVFVVVMAVLCLITYAANQVFKYSLLLRFFYIAIVAIIIGIFSLSIKFGRFIYRRFSNVSQVKTELINQVKDLIGNSRKGIATITDITYLPVPEDTIAIKLSGNQTYLSVTKSQPNFRIRYKFNPPDDKREEDIIHEYITHAAPENHYKAGDPMPILYNIEDHYFYDTVRSMPFPLPINDLSDNEQIIGQSSSIGKNYYTNTNSVLKMTGISYVDERIRAIDSVTADNIAQIKRLKKRVPLCYAYSYTERMIVIPHIARLLLDARYAACHGECIGLLVQFAFPIGSKVDRTIEAFDLIKQYMYMQPRTEQCPTVDAIHNLLHIKYCAQNYGFENDLQDDYYVGLLSIMSDPNVSPGVRFMIASSFWYRVPERYLEGAIKEIEKLDLDNIIQTLPYKYRDIPYKTKKEILNSLRITLRKH